MFCDNIYVCLRSLSLLVSRPFSYACGQNHDDGEFAHWAPFQAVAAQYIRQHYPAPRSDAGDKLVVFMLGVVSHYEADIIWHGLQKAPAGYGMIETIGGLSFNCTGSLGGMHCLDGTVSGDVAHSQAGNNTYYVIALCIFFIVVILVVALYSLFLMFSY